MHEQLVDALVLSPNDAADDLLLEGLRLGNEVEQALVLEALLKRGVIVRDMNSYGLPEWIRVSIGTAEQNQRFLADLKRQPNLAIQRREPATIG